MLGLLGSLLETGEGNTKFKGYFEDLQTLEEVENFNTNLI